VKSSVKFAVVSAVIKSLLQEPVGNNFP
jgi:hypothetical protein